MVDDSLSAAHNNAIYALGLFVLGWSTLEATLEVAIANELGADPETGSIVTAGLAFKSRTSTLKGLLNRDPVKNSEALTLLASLQNKPDRNDLMHSIIGRDGDKLVFTRRKSDGKFKSTEKPYDVISLLQMTADITLEIGKLRKALGIADDKYQAYFDAAHKAANKA